MRFFQRMDRAKGVFGVLGLLVVTAVTLLSLRQEVGVSYAVGSPVFVDDVGAPLANQPLRLLCYETAAGPHLADVMVTTAVDGSATLPTNCPFLQALWLRHTQPSGKPAHGPAFWVYTTSFVPGTGTAVPAAGTIEIKDANSLVLFNVLVSLGWALEPGDPYVGELQAGLAAASAYLYDITEGQAAFGPVTMYDDGRHWQGADFRVMPGNDYRPAAYPGGIVPTTTPFAGPWDTVDFEPAHIFLGRYWNGNDAYTGPWDVVNGYSTIMHEWSHYALFLFDEYIQTAGYATYCVCTTLPTGCGTPGGLDGSIMAYHYTTSELWHDVTHSIPAACTSTHHFYQYGVSDWKVLDMWHMIQGITFPSPSFRPLRIPGSLTAGPLPGVVADLYGRVPGHAVYLPSITTPGAPTPGALNADVSVYLNHPAIFTATLPTEVYLLEDAAGGAPARITHQGRLLDPAPAFYRLGQVDVWGVAAADRLRVYADQYATASAPGGRYTFPLPGDPNDPMPYDGLQVEVKPDAWGVSLDLTQELTDGRFTKLIAHFSSPGHALGTVTARLCTLDADEGCAAYWTQTMIPTDPSGREWQATFEPAPGALELPTYGIVYIEEATLGQVINWYQSAGGVGPGHIAGDAPLRDWHVMVDTEEDLPPPDECNHVIVSPAKNVDALMASLGQDGQGATITGLVGRPLDIDIFLPNHSGLCQQIGAPDHLLPVNVTLTLFYSQEEIDRLGISEFDLRLLRFYRGNNVWDWGPTLAQNTELNWLSTTIDLDGIYAIGFVGSP